MRSGRGRCYGWILYLIGFLGICYGKAMTGNQLLASNIVFRSPRYWSVLTTASLPRCNSELSLPL